MHIRAWYRDRLAARKQKRAFDVLSFPDNGPGGKGK